MARTRWFQQMAEIGLLPPAVDLTRIIEEVEFGPPSQADVPRPLADLDDPALVEPTTLISTSSLDSTLQHFFLDDDGTGDPSSRASDSSEDNAATYAVAKRASATGSSVQSSTRRKRKRTIDASEPHSQSPARDAAAPLFAPSTSSSKRSRSNGTLIPAYPCARCIEKGIESQCRICYVGGACNVCRARGRKCDLVDPETKHTHTGSIAKNLVKRGKNSKASAGKLRL